MPKIFAHRLLRIVAVVALASSLAGCDKISQLVNTFKHIWAVQDDLAAETGMKPNVNVHWQNGRMDLVQVAFPHPYDKKPLAELTEDVRRIIAKEFAQTPEEIVISFGAATGSPSQTEHKGGEEI